MEKFKTMPPEIYLVWTNAFEKRTVTLLKQFRCVLMALAEDLVGQDIPGIVPNFFRITDNNEKTIPAPTLERSYLRTLDPQRQLTGQLAARQPNWQRQLKDEEFVPIMQAWLRGCEPAKQKQILKACLDKTDVQGISKMFRFTSAGKEPILLRLANTRYGIPEQAFKRELENYSELRNLIMGHLNDVERQTLTPGLYYDNLKKLIDLLRRCTVAQVRHETDATQKLLQENLFLLSQEPLLIRDLEQKHGFPVGTLGSKLKENIFCKEFVDENATVIISVRETDLLPILSHLKLSQQLAQETADSGLAPLPKTGTVRLQLPAYTAGKFNAAQLRYFADHFSLVADVGTLLSQDGLSLIANVLVPVLVEAKKRLQIDWSTLVHIYRTEKEATDEALRQTARLARHQIYHLQHMGLIRYVGSSCGDPDPRRSLQQLLEDNKTEPVCVITTDKELAVQLSTDKTPYVLCMGLWGSRGFALRSECAERYANFGNHGQTPEPEQEADEPAAPVPQNISVPEATPSFPDTVPGAHETVLDENGTKLLLHKVKGQPGGEGAVYSTSRAGQVAKIYHPDKLTKERFDKLTAMRALSLQINSVCWPTSLLYDTNHRFVGFLMAAAPEDAEEMGSSVMKLGGKSVSQEKMPGWDRASIVQCAIAVCRTFEALHQHNILMGDVNPRNILVSMSQPDQVYFVDCDSYQVGKYICPVGMTEYSSPQMLQRVAATPGGYAACPRTMEDENFALTTLLFKMLMLGQTPFAAKNAANRMEAVRDYSFAFKSETTTGYDAPDGPAHMIWSNTPKHLKDKFAQVFLGQQTYDASVWAGEFSYYLKKLEDGTHTKLLRPLKYPDFSGDLFEDFTCVFCGAEANMAKEQFKKLIDQPKFCRACRTTVNRSRGIPQKMRCDACGQHSDGTAYDQIMQDFGRKWFCDSCRTAVCTDCGKTFSLNAKNIEKRRQGKLPYPRCYDCFKKREENKNWK